MGPKLPPKPHEAGKVPKYLQKYKEAAEKLKHQPRGTTLMPEGERLEMLKELQANKEKVNGLLAKMPISMQTVSIQRQKKELEAKLVQIEKAMEVMSRKNVFVSA